MTDPMSAPRDWSLLFLIILLIAMDLAQSARIDYLARRLDSLQMSVDALERK